MPKRAPNQVTLSALLALQAKARGLDLSSRKRVLTDNAGTHLSGFRGRGMEFEEHRIYQAGDDVRAIDWRVTARTGTAHIKRFREERERPVYLLADFSSPMLFATRGVFKSVLAAEAAAMLGWAAVANRDRIGGIVVGPQSLAEVRPASGNKGLLRYCNQLAESHQQALDFALADTLAKTPPEEPSESQLLKALLHVQRLARGGAVVVVMSDFQSLPESAATVLQKLASRCELIVGMVSDPFERELPPQKSLPVTTVGQLQQRWFLKPQADQKDWSRCFAERQAFWTRQLLPFGSHVLNLDTATPLRDQLARGLGQAHQVGVAS